MSKLSPYKMTLCPMTYVLEILGDKWTFLIIRDMLFKCNCRYQHFMDSDEGIATNILADRLKKLVHNGIVEQHKDPANGRKKIYTLTQKGLDLTPAILHLIKWSGDYDSDSLIGEEIMSKLNNQFNDCVEFVINHYLQEHST